MRFIDEIIQLNLSPSVKPGVPEDQYRALPGLNPSSIAAGLMANNEVDPVLIKRAYEGLPPRRTQAQQDRLDRGTLCHLMVLQPELVADRVAVWHGDRRAGHEWDEFVNANAGKLLMRSEDHQEIVTASEQALNTPRFRSIFGGCKVEVSLSGTHGEVLTKGRVDACKAGDMHVIADLKTTEAGIDQRSVMNTIRSFHYREKMAMYRRMYCQATGTPTDLVQCFNVFVKLPPPCAIRIIKFTTAALEWGEWRIGQAI